MSPYKDPEKQREYQREWGRKHSQQRKQYGKKYKQRQKNKLIEYKKGKVCERCGDPRWYVLEFHHKDPNKKNENVATLVFRRAWKVVLEEIKKCILLCANCHKEIHYLGE